MIRRDVLSTIHLGRQRNRIGPGDVTLIDQIPIVDSCGIEIDDRKARIMIAPQCSGVDDRDRMEVANHSQSH